MITFNLTSTYYEDKNIFKENKKLLEQIKELNDLFLKETYNGNKVAYYYEDLNNNSFSYNSDICFYAASSIKILVCLMLFEEAENNRIDLKEKVLVTIKDLKQGTGIIKNQKCDTYYSLLELIKLTIKESDNTAYLKLVSIVGKDKIKEYGLALGAEHTMEGKPTDSFGIINCQDMIIYWKKIKSYIDSESNYSFLFKEYLSNPTFKIIEDKSLNNFNYIRKFGSYDIAYHEAGYVESNNPFFLIILTQLNKMDYKEKFVNDTAKIIININNLLD